jgi:transposase
MILKGKLLSKTEERRKMVKRYIVELTSSERDELLALISAGESSARKLKRANILLLSDKEMKDEDIAETLHTSVSTIERTRRRCVLEGMTASLNERPRPGARCKLDAKAEAVLETLAKSKPPDGRKRWTMQLLADRLVELKVVDSISDETVRKQLKKKIEASD